MSREPDNRNGRIERDASESKVDRTEQDFDGPREDLSPARSSRPKSDA